MFTFLRQNSVVTAAPEIMKRMELLFNDFIHVSNPKYHQTSDKPDYPLFH